MSPTKHLFQLNHKTKRTVDVSIKKVSVVAESDLFLYDLNEPNFILQLRCGPPLRQSP